MLSNLVKYTLAGLGVGAITGAVLGYGVEKHYENEREKAIADEEARLNRLTATERKLNDLKKRASDEVIDVD